MDFLISDLRLILHLLIAGKPFGRSAPAMNTKLLVASIVVVGFSILYGCKKHNTLSASDEITGFAFKAADNPSLKADVYGVIGTDTITVGVPQATDLSALIPLITYSGQTLHPGSGVDQDFSLPVQYTVTAQDGATRSYVVIVNRLSAAKAITSFVFRAANNQGLTADVAGSIGNDTIRVNMDPTVGVTALVPSIVITGVSISPADSAVQNFSVPVRYTVTAADGTSKVYTVIVGANVVVYVGSNDNYLYALDAVTGALIWKAATGGAINSSPTLAGGVVYVGSEDSYVYAFDAGTGALKWKYFADGAVDGSPTVAGGVVYVDHNNSNYINAGNSLLALDAVTGAELWQYGGNTPYIAQSPTVSGGTVYWINTFTGPGILALNAGTGALQWSAYDGWDYAFNPAVNGGTLYVGVSMAVAAAFDLQTHAMKWIYTVHTSTDSLSLVGSAGSPTVGNGLVYIPGYDGYLYALDAQVGNLIWKQPSKGAVGGSMSGSGVFSSPVFWNGMVFAGNNDSYLYALDAATGAVKWTYSIGGIVQPGVGPANPTVANGVLYCGDYIGNFYAFDANTGAVKWTYTTGGPVYSGPCVLDAGGNVFHPGVSGDQQ
jgi:outer membrane protein assembly factor BamB